MLCADGFGRRTEEGEEKGRKETRVMDGLGFGRRTNEGDEEKEARNRVLQEFMCCCEKLEI